MKPTVRQYATRDAEALGEYYVRHVMAMTSERLHDKGDIAAELAHRDARIARLLEVLSFAHAHIIRHHEVGISTSRIAGGFCHVCHRKNGSEPEMEAIREALSPANASDEGQTGKGGHHDN